MAKVTDRQAGTGKCGREFMEGEWRCLGSDRLGGFSLARAELGHGGYRD